jgi:hypothetical protein
VYRGQLYLVLRHVDVFHEGGRTVPPLTQGHVYV